jgi:hypothetical protein
MVWSRQQHQVANAVIEAENPLEDTAELWLENSRL